MKVSTIASLALAGFLVFAPTAFGGGLGGINLPHGHFNSGSDAASDQISKPRYSFSANLYAPSDQSSASHWHIGPYWWGYPFGFAVFSK